MTELVVVIEPGRQSVRAELDEVRSRLGLLYFLIWRDLKVRYRQTAVGALWAVVQPLALALVFAVFFGRLADVPSDGQSYALFALSGFAIWGFFASGAEAATNSLVNNVNLVTKVYFPRIILPLASIGAFLLDLVLSTITAAVFSVIAGPGLGLRTLTLAGAFVWASAVTFAVGTTLGALNVKYRDIRHALRFLLQVWLFVSPVAYSWTLIPQRWRIAYGVNPMAGVVSLYRWAIAGGPAPPMGILIPSAMTTLLLIMTSLVTFRRAQASFSDLI